MPLNVRLRRAGYRVAFGVLRLFWWAARPRLTGVKCVLLDAGGRVLLVRHSYGPPAWDLPGGITRRREAPLHTARREMAEELGVDDDGWSTLGVVHGRNMNRHDTIHVFGLRLPETAPELTLDPVELLTSMWCEPRSLPEPLAFYATRILRELEADPQLS